MKARISGTGSYTPSRIMTNAELERMVATSDEWIRGRTGILARRRAHPKESTAGLATKAAWMTKPATGAASGVSPGGSFPPGTAPPGSAPGAPVPAPVSP